MSTEVSDVIVPWEVCMKKGPEESPKPVPAPLCCVIPSWTVDMSLLLQQI